MNITEDKVKAYGLIALGALGVYIIWKAIESGKEAASSVADTLHSIAEVPSKIIDAITPPKGPINHYATGSEGDITNPVHVNTRPVSVLDGNTDSIYDPMTGVKIGMDSVNAGRFSVASENANLSPNAFQAMTDNYANINIDLTGFNGGDA